MTEWVTEIEGEMDGVDEPVYDWETLGVDETEHQVSRALGHPSLAEWQ